MCGHDCQEGRDCDCTDQPIYTPETAVDLFLLFLLSTITALLIAVPLYLAVTQ